MKSSAWSVLIVDDEPPIREELRYLLGRDARVGAIDEAGSGGEAIQKILERRPDVLFLDIQMPGTNGMRIADTLSGLKNPPLLVFVTAFNEFAADAFDLNAVDYVLKPVEEARLARTLDKLAARLDVQRASARDGAPMRLSVERGGTRMFIPVSDVCYFEAHADYSWVVTASGTYLMAESISSLEERLEKEGFMRVHRSYLVNIDDVHDVLVPRPGTLELRLERVDATVPVSRRRTAAVRERLGLS